MYVREQNFGRPFTIWQSRTGSNKGPLEGSRQVQHGRICARMRTKLRRRDLRPRGSETWNSQTHFR